MKYKEFLSIIKFTYIKSRILLLINKSVTCKKVTKYNKNRYFRLIKLSNYLLFLSVYKVEKFKYFKMFWKYYRLDLQNKLFYFLQWNKNYTTFYFSYKTRNLFCIIQQDCNVETFFSSYLLSSRRLRNALLPQFKILRYLIYLYFSEFSSFIKLYFSGFSVKIKYIIKFFFHWLVFYSKVFNIKYSYKLYSLEINNKFYDPKIKKRSYPAKKRYLQRKARFNRILF